MTIGTLAISGRFDAHQVPQVQQEIDAMLAAQTLSLIHISEPTRPY